MSNHTLESSVQSGDPAGEKAGPVGRDLREAKVSTAANASAKQNLAPAQTASSAAGPAAGEDLGADLVAGAPLLAGCRDLPQTAAQTAATVRDRLAEISSAMSRAGATLQTLGADFDRFWAGWSRGLAPDQVQRALNPGSASSEQTGPVVDESADQPRPARAPGENSPMHACVEPLTRSGTAEGGREETPSEIHEATSEPPHVGGYEVCGETGMPPQPDPAGTAGPTQFAPLPGEPARESPVGEPANRELSNPVAPFAPASPRQAVAGFAQTDATSSLVTARNLADPLSLNPGGSGEAAQANLLLLLEQTLAGHQRTLAQAVKLVEAQSSNANVTLTLLANAHTKIAAAHARLEQLEAQHGSARNTQTSG